MKDFDTLFDGKLEVEDTANEPVTTQEPAPKAADEPQVDPNAPEASEAGEGEPTSPEHGKNVPLSALEAVRREKADHKGRADRFEGELTALKAEMERLRQSPQNQQPQAEAPVLTLDERLFNERAHFSEMMIRQKHTDVDEKFAAFNKAAESNPALKAAILQQQDPWGYVYQQGTRLMAMQEIGDDPAAFRERVKEEIRQQLLAEQGGTAPATAATPPAAPLPQSLANARSSASRSAPAHTGPRPFDDLFTA